MSKRKNPAAVALGKLAKGKTSARKAASSAANGKLGGRPRKNPLPPAAQPHPQIGTATSAG